MFIGKKTNQNTGPLRIQATQTALSVASNSIIFSVYSYQMF